MRVIGLGLLCAQMAGAAEERKLPDHIEPGKAIAFVGVNVVPMSAAGVIENRTVLVKDGLIAALGRVGKTTLPEGTLEIDARGLYLMPGLCDMHVHNWYAEEHLLFVANGVTCVRNMWGNPMHLRWRREIEAGERLGPRIFTTGPLLDGKPPLWQGSTIVETAEQAAAAVAEQKQAGYDAIKVYNGLKPEAYAALVEAAAAQGLPVYGHVPKAVGIEGVLKARQGSIEHLTGYLQRWTEGDPALFAAQAKATAEAGTWNCPTTVVFQKFVPLAEANKLRARPEMKYVPPKLLATWDPTKDFRSRNLKPEQFAAIKRANGTRLKLIKAMHDAGARLILGTDCANPFVVAGWSVHEELQNFVDAGLSPYEALRTSTADAAEFLGRAPEFGTVEVGKRADLILVKGNPLDDVAHAARRAGVVVRGRWLSQTELQRRLEALAESYKAPKDRFAGLDPLPRQMKTFFSGSFEVFWNGVSGGATRFTVARLNMGDFEVVGQQVSDPPFEVRHQLRLLMDASGLLRSLQLESRSTEGRLKCDGKLEGNALTLRVIWKGEGWVLKEELAEGTVLAIPVLAGMLPVYRRLHQLGLKTGEKGSITVREMVLFPKVRLIDVKLTAERLADVERKTPQGQVKASAYHLLFERPDRTTPVRVELDPQGIPVEIISKLQLGEVHFKRIKPPVTPPAPATSPVK
ncbi:MAG: amidohydrolase family protein [Planctomycetota bacterium]